MNIDKNLLNCICKQDVHSSAKLVWLLVNVEEKDRSGFCYLSQPEWSEKLNLSVRQLKRTIKQLHDKYLIERDYRPNEEGGKKLFVKTCKPETLDNMTFFAQFEEIEKRDYNHFGLVRTARFKNIRNINNTICINHTWCDLKDGDFNSRALESIEEDGYVCFQARVTKTEKGYFLNNIHNIRRIHEYYDNR